MYVPAAPAPAAPALAPVGIVSVAPVELLPPAAHTHLSVRRTHLNVLVGQTATVSGRLVEVGRQSTPGRVIALQARGRHGWSTISRTRTHSHGAFRLTLRPKRLGSETVRLRFAGSAEALPAHRRIGRISAYRLAGASWYGGGGGLACGGELTSSTIGVANKTLPCGTMVTLHYGQRTMRVPVIDRGPYVAGRDFDLTEATKRELGFGDTGDVWSTD